MQQCHYSDVIKSAMASQITSISIVYLTVCSVEYQSKHQSSSSLAFVGDVTGHRWIPRTMKGQLRGKFFHLMTSTCYPSLSIRGLQYRAWAYGLIASETDLTNIFFCDPTVNISILNSIISNISCIVAEILFVLDKEINCHKQYG